MKLRRSTVPCLRNLSAVETQQYNLCVVVVFELHVALKHITILNVTQQWFYGKLVTDNNANYK
jgi:hypothetical protein